MDARPSEATPEPRAGGATTDGTPDSPVGGEHLKAAESAIAQARAKSGGPPSSKT